MNALITAVETTIDKGGRIVIPKAVRDALGLTANGEIRIELDVRAGNITVAPRPVAKHLERHDGMPVIVPEEALPSLTVERVRELLDRVRDRDLH